MKTLAAYINQLDFAYAKLYSKLRNNTWIEERGDRHLEVLRIVDRKGRVHQSAKEIKVWRSQESGLNRIFQILKIKFEDRYDWMCGRIYREAIVFYSNQDNVVGILNICFDCDAIADENGEEFEVDAKICPLLQTEFRKWMPTMDKNTSV